MFGDSLVVRVLPVSDKRLSQYLHVQHFFEMTLFLNRSTLLETILSQVDAKMVPVTPTSMTDATCRPD